MDCRPDRLAFTFAGDNLAAYQRLYEQNIALARQIAATLDVPAPEAWRPERVANALTEFRHGVTADPQGTATSLARLYSTEHAYVFRLGALAGYEQGVRAVVGESTSVYGLDIRTIAPRTGLPDSLWKPLTENHREVPPRAGSPGLKPACTR